MQPSMQGNATAGSAAGAAAPRECPVVAGLTYSSGAAD